MSIQYWLFTLSEKYRNKFITRIYCFYMNHYVIPFKEYPFSRNMWTDFINRQVQEIEDNYIVLRM